MRCRQGHNQSGFSFHSGSLNSVAFQWAAHAARAAATASQFVARDRQHGDPRFVVFLVGPDVALIADHHARADGEHVVGVVPLLALGFKGVAAGGDQAYLINTERFLDGVQQVGFPVRSRPPRPSGVSVQHWASLRTTSG